jgi:hypothetical protein
LEWDIEYTDEFEDWWDDPSEAEQESVADSVLLIGDFGPTLRYPQTLEREKKERI